MGARARVRAVNRPGASRANTGHIWMSNQADGGTAGAVLGLLMLLGVGSCMFGGSSDKKDKTAEAPTNRVDAPYLASDSGLKAAHDESGEGDGFGEIIALKHSECWKSITATRTSPNQYQVICSSDMTGSTLNFTKFMVDTSTGDSIIIMGA